MSDPRSVVLARLGEHVITLFDALTCHKLGQCGDFLQAAIEGAAMDLAIARAGLTAAPQEVAAAMTTLCHRHHLASDTARRAWLQGQGLSEAEFRLMAEKQVLTEKLRAHVSAGHVERFFAERKADFDFAVLSRIIVADRALAEMVRRQADNPEADFRLLAIRHTIDEDTAVSAGYLGPVVRSQLPAALQKAVFAAEAGDVVGPVETDDGWHVIKLWAISNASLEGETRATIADLVFDAWLAQECAAAEVLLGDAHVAAE